MMAVRVGSENAILRVGYHFPDTPPLIPTSPIAWWRVRRLQLIGGSFAKRISSSFVLQSCLTCAALPLVKSPGTAVTCTTLSEAEARIAAPDAAGGLTGAG